MGRFWGAPPRPRATMKSIMSSVHRTFWAPGDTATLTSFDGKEGVDGSSPSEGFIGDPRYGGVFSFPAIRASLAPIALGSFVGPLGSVLARTSSHARDATRVSCAVGRLRKRRPSFAHEFRTRHALRRPRRHRGVDRRGVGAAAARRRPLDAPRDRSWRAARKQDLRDPRLGSGCRCVVARAFRRSIGRGRANSAGGAGSGRRVCLNEVLGAVERGDRLPLPPRTGGA